MNLLHQRQHFTQSNTLGHPIDIFLGYNLIGSYYPKYAGCTCFCIATSRIDRCPDLESPAEAVFCSGNDADDSTE